MQRFFWDTEDLILVQLTLIIQKISKKINCCYFSCLTLNLGLGGYGGTVVQTFELFSPDGSNMTHNDPG